MKHQLVVFKIVADKKSFSQAAKELYISQPAISLQIQSLEEQLGTRLFDRNNKRVSLTQAGATFYDYAKKILELYEQAEKDISDLTGTVKGRINIGATLTIGEYVLPHIAGHFLKEYPMVNLSVNIANTKQITKNLLTNDFDIGLVEGKVKHPDLIIQSFMEDELVVTVPNDHPWASLEYIPPSLLFTEPFIHREKGSGTRQIMEDALQEHNINTSKFQVAMEFGSTQAIKEAVIAGLGVSIISKMTIKNDLKQNTLGMTRLENCNINRVLNLVYNKHHFKSQTMEAFMKYVFSKDLHKIIKDEE